MRVFGTHSAWASLAATGATQVLSFGPSVAMAAHRMPLKVEQPSRAGRMKIGRRGSLGSYSSPHVAHLLSLVSSLWRQRGLPQARLRFFTNRGVSPEQKRSSLRPKLPGEMPARWPIVVLSRGR